MMGQAERHFLERWIIDDVIVGPMFLDRLARALSGGGDETPHWLQTALFPEEDS